MAYGPNIQGFNNFNPSPDYWQQTRQPINMPLPTAERSNSTQLPCRTFNDPSEIKPNEVPMDGRIALFMAYDNSRIIAKQWNQNGLIDTVEYIPNVPKNSGAESIPFDKQILERLDRLDQMLSSLMSPVETSGGVSNES